MKSIRWTLFLCVLSLTTPAAAQLVVTPGPGPVPVGVLKPQPKFNQFGPFKTPPYSFDEVRGEWVNLETQQIKPIAVTADGELVIVGNDADNRVVFLDSDLRLLAETRVGQGISAIAERPGLPAADGEIWVTLRHQTAVVVISRRSFHVTHVLRPRIKNLETGAGNASTPGGIAFNTHEYVDPAGNLIKPGERAFVAASMTNKLVVHDTATKKVAEVVDLTGIHNGREISLNEPRTIVEFKGEIYVASHLSGNQSTTSQSLQPGGGLGTLGPDSVKIIDLSTDPDRSLPGFDVARYDPAAGSVTMITDLYTTGFGMVGHPGTGRIAVSAFNSHNAKFTGEGAFPQGAVVTNGIAHFEVNNPGSTKAFLPTENLGAGGDHLVLPIDMAVDPSNRIFVAGYGSSQVGVFLGNGVYQGTIDTEDGPAGVVVSQIDKRLYVYNRIDNTVQSFDISNSGGVPTNPVRTLVLSDPTFDDVKEGRRIFNTPNSGHGATNCASCHPEARKDGLAWQLSKFFELPPGDDDNTFKDFKGVMVTQDLRSLEGTAPYHWRGEQRDLDDFNGAFVDLLKGSLISDEKMEKMKAYLFSCNFPPNPDQPMNRMFSPLALTGFDEYTTPYRCDGCHRLPTGTDCSITDLIVGMTASPRTVETTHLLGLWSKHSDIANTDNNNPNPADEFPLQPMTGFGFAHEGVINSVDQFNRVFFSNQNVPALNEFLVEFDSGLAPFTSFCRTLDSNTAGGVGRITRYMIPQAEAGNGDLVASGRLRIAGTWVNVGLWFDPSLGAFRPDTTSLGTFTLASLRSLALAGDAELLLYGVPFWSGPRVALDRDRDGVFDGDERAQGLNPTNPDSDGDGLWDGYDATPLDSDFNVLPVSAPAVVPGSVRVVYENTNNVKLQYETDSWSPTDLEFGDTAALGFFYGDGLLPTGPANDSNHWKRKHTAFLRPQISQGLGELNDGTVYDFVIRTQGQNGMTAQTPASLVLPGLPSTATDIINPNNRVDSILLTVVDNGDRTYTYTATVELIRNDGTAVPDNRCVPGRFAIYDTAGAFSLVPLALETLNSRVVFSHTTSAGQQVAGDRTSFDLPMSLTVPHCDPMNTSGVVAFPGHWPAGPSSVEITAP